MFESEEIDFYIYTDPRLSDLKSEGELRDRLIEEVKKKKIPLEEFILQAEWFKEKLEKRAYQGVQALKDIALANLRKTVLICSHGISRMEIAIQALKKEKIENPKCLLKQDKL